MLTRKSAPKSQVDRLTLIEEDMFLKEIHDTVSFLEGQVTKLNKKVEGIDTIGACLDGLSIKELMYRVDSLEERVA